MRRIFPSKHSSSSNNNSSSCSASSALKPPLRKEKADGSRQALVKRQEVDVNSINRREHWCPSCPPGGEGRCETPPSGDENAAAKGPNTNQQIPHTRLGLPEECQDKQIVRPLLKAISTTTRGSSSPERGALQWTSGLQDALDELVEDSRREPVWKYPSNPPSPPLSPPLVGRRKPHDNMSSSSFMPGSASSDQSVNQSVRKYSTALLPGAEEVSENVLLPKLSRSRSSNSGASIMSNPRSHSFSDWSRGTTPDNFSNRSEFSTDEFSRGRSQSRYLSARVVAEKLVKAMRGSSKLKDSKRPPPFPQTQSRPKEQEEAVQFKQDNEFFRHQLDSHNEDIGFIFEGLEERLASAEKLLLIADAELNSVDVLQGEKKAGKFSSRELDKHEGLNRKIKKLQKERRELAEEVLGEVRLRNMERITVREVLGFMKRDMEFWLRTLKRDKAELEAKLEQAVPDGGELQEELRKCSEDKERLERELTIVTSRESALRLKIREFEQHMSGHIARVEGAERTILELKESLKTGQQKLLQSEQEGERLRREVQLARHSAHNEEVAHLRRLLDSATERAAKLENQVRDKDRQLGNLHSELRQKSQEVCAARQELASVARERDSMKLEAEEMGREALRTSAEAEVLRRRVHQLEEDVMLREGELCIMRGSLHNDESL